MAVPSLARRASLWCPPLAYAAVIFYLSAQSNPFPRVMAVLWDKAVHATEYAALTVLLLRALRGEGRRWIAALACAVVLSSAYGASDEWHQSFVAGRSSDPRDWLADTAGAAIGGTLVVIAVRTLGRRRPRVGGA